MMLKFDSHGFKEAQEALRLLTLPPGIKRKYLARMGRMAIAQGKKNIKDQKTVDGSPMEPRKRKPPKERPVYHKSGSVTTKKTHNKMLVDMVKGKWLGVKTSDDAAVVFFFRGVGYVAFKHQHGSEENYKLKINAKFPKADYSKKCNASQALELIKTGMQQNGKRVSKAWIMGHITVGHAANLLKRVKSSWKIKTPARPFLGASQEQISEWGNVLMNSLEERFRAKQYGHMLT